MRLAVVLTHPVQYYSPLFAALSQREVIEIKVFYTWQQWKESNFDRDFGKSINWDIPLLSGYEYEFIPNEARNPGIYSFWGINNGTLISSILHWEADAVLVFGWNYASHLRVMRYFKDKLPVYFRGDSTLLDYPVKAVRDLFSTRIRFSSTFSLVKFGLRSVFLSWIYSHVDFAFCVGRENKNYFLVLQRKSQNIAKIFKFLTD